MNRAQPRWTLVHIDCPRQRRRRLPPFVWAIGLAALVWVAIAVVGVVLGGWLA